MKNNHKIFQLSPKKFAYLKSLLLVSLFFIYFPLFAQSDKNAVTYYPSNYSQQPIVTFHEGFLNRRTYFLDGIKSQPKDVTALLKSIQNEDFDIHSLQQKKTWGTAIRLTGLGVGIGTFAYLFTNEITPSNIRPLIWFSMGSIILQVTGNSLVENSQTRITKAIDDFNAYHFVGSSSKFLKMDVRNQFLGPKIDIYEGTKLLQTDQVSLILKSNEKAFEAISMIQKRQKVSKVAHVVDQGLSIGILFLALGYQKQSSTQSDLLFPLILTGTGLRIFSSNYDRRTRNLARMALNEYNYD